MKLHSRRFAHRALAALLLLLQVGLVVAPDCEAHTSEFWAPHVESTGVKHVTVHDEDRCQLCNVQTVVAQVPITAPTPAIVAVTAPIIADGARRVISRHVDPARASRAPPTLV
jgi:hypothetical protein